MEPMAGLDGAFLSIETVNDRLDVAGVVVLDPPAGTGPPPGPASRYEAIRRVVEQRLDLVPQFRQRAVRVPLGLHHPVWARDPCFSLDDHVRPAVAPAPGGRGELEEVVGEILGRPLDPGRPLWEMVVVEGLAGGRTAVVARLHHAILDGVSGASVMAAFLDLEPGPDGSRSARAGGRESAEGSEPEGPAVPSAVSMLGYAAASVGRQAVAARDAVRLLGSAVAELVARNRLLATQGGAPPPPLFSAPRTGLNGAVCAQRGFASLAVPVDDLQLVRRRLRAASGGATVNDVMLCAVGGALARLLARRGEAPDRPLVALVPVSTRDGGAPALGNQVSGMLVTLVSTVADPVERLRRVTAASRTAKAQHRLDGGLLLRGLAEAVPPIVVRGAMRAWSAMGLFDRARPLANVAVSNVLVPDVPLWWAGCPVREVYPAGPVAAGIGLNITSMTYRGVVHFGLLGSGRLVPDLKELVVLLDDAIAELVVVALDRGAGHGTTV